jgi:hypothetical protein
MLKENDMGIFLSGNNKTLPESIGCADVSRRMLLAICFTAVLLFLTVAVFAANLGYADEEDQRRVDISLSIFPRIVAVDNHFREKLVSKNKVQLLFL